MLTRLGNSLLNTSVLKLAKNPKGRGFFPFGNQAKLFPLETSC